MTRGEGARRMTAAERGSGDGRRTSTSAAITIARVIFVSLVGYGGYLLVQSFDPPARWLLWAPLAVLGGVLAGVAVVALEQAARRLPMPRLFLSAIGALGGVLLAQLVASALIVFLPAAGSSGGRGFLSLLLAYMGVVFVLRREEELGGITRMVFPHATAGEVRYKVLDTSVIIDGRIADVCQAGFLEGTLLVPQYVLRELQQIADSSDPLKRNRGRRGLDVLQRLQRLPGVRTELHDLDFPHIREVDARLIETVHEARVETTAGDELVAPFAGAGAISDWQLELPASNGFDFGTITDVIVRLEYTACA